MNVIPCICGSRAPYSRVVIDRLDDGQLKASVEGVCEQCDKLLVKAISVEDAILLQHELAKKKPGLSLQDAKKITEMVSNLWVDRINTEGKILDAMRVMTGRNRYTADEMASQLRSIRDRPSDESVLSAEQLRDFLKDFLASS
ncbi:MAG: hypothetical protein P4N59_20915 [Negativicutes bacterium]|nr:hypothetical protein [Negativicutes bacterium]